MNTIIQCTDNSLDPAIATLCQRILVREAQGIPIICVSQEPVDFGQNVVVGKIGRSWTSLYKQLLAGIEVAETDWVVICEHDVIYSHEYIHYEPKDATVFHYNASCWLVEGPGTNHPPLLGMFSYWPKRLALSQLICNKYLLKEALEERLAILETGGTMDRNYLGYGEPGVISQRMIQKAKRAADSGRPIQLQPYLQDYLKKYDHKVFETKIPNIDIRHNSNWSGRKRGKSRRYELPYWGTWADIWGTNVL